MAAQRAKLAKASDAKLPGFVDSRSTCQRGCQFRYLPELLSRPRTVCASKGDRNVPNYQYCSRIPSVDLLILSSTRPNRHWHALFQSVLRRTAPQWRMGARTIPVIDSARCTGCGRCVAACAPHALSLQPMGWVKSAVLNDDVGCTGCARCLVVCPFGAIEMVHRGHAKVQGKCTGSPHK